MRIFFVGSVPDNAYNREPEPEREKILKNQPLWTAAGDIGKEAAKRGDTIMVGSDRPTTIDHYIVNEGLLYEAKQIKNRDFI